MRQPAAAAGLILLAATALLGAKFNLGTIAGD